ncbi:MAG TPA: response regulator transcription factor [Thermomonas sp.]|jgi:DNA-binding CsgD family transcriptional regulator|uniref:helix-turn-helix transcriptional regulator n=1 Tax=Thermomonas sp. TaxID=1971895 RepID=UPI002C80FAF8|nr:response regulator transcription factor [Thermomonas sp.]HPM56336.1 response regulator transcription factor [Thermomonas sp.]
MRPRFAMPWTHIALYAALLAGGTVALQWLDYQRLVRSYPSAIYDGLLATGFLALGLWLGMRLLGRGASPAEPAGEGNPRAAEALGISPRELEVLHEIAAGHSNKEIALRLHVSPNTVKTHVARLLEKLEARRRTDALRKARELGLVP